MNNVYTKSIFRQPERSIRLTPRLNKAYTEGHELSHERLEYRSSATHFHLPLGFVLLPLLVDSEAPPDSESLVSASRNDRRLVRADGHVEHAGFVAFEPGNLLQTGVAPDDDLVARVPVRRNDLAVLF